MENWYLKLTLLAAGFLVVAVISLKNFRRNKKYYGYLLILLYANTGFAYHFENGIETSAAEVLFAGLVLIMCLSFLSRARSPIVLNIGSPLKLYTVVGAVGIPVAFWFSVDPKFMFAEIKVYYFYLFYLFLVPFLEPSKEDIRKYVWFWSIVCWIPIVYWLPSFGLADRTAGSSWGALNILVGFSIPSFLLCLGQYTSMPRSRRRYFLFLTAFFLAAIVVGSLTRSGWLALLFGLICYVTLSQQRGKALGSIVALTALLVLVSGSVLYNAVEERIEFTASELDSSLQKRFDRWNVAWKTFINYPLTGAGWGSRLPLNPDGSITPRSWPTLPSWHNSVFEILSQLGLIGLGAFVWLWYRAIMFAYEVIPHCRDIRDRTLLVSMVSAVLACLIYSLAEQQLLRIETASVTWFLAGVMVTFANHIRSEINLPVKLKRKRRLSVGSSASLESR